MSILWQIGVIEYDANMEKVREACADLLQGEQPTEHNSIIVNSQRVGEAVRRINELGYSTDEDEEKQIITFLEQESEKQS